MKIIFHIGTHKTGTTAIQEFFANNRSQMATKGFLYPSSYAKLNAHHNLAWSLGVQHPERDNRLTPAEIAGAILAEAQTHCAEAVLLSSEEFRNLEDVAKLRKLQELFPDAEHQIIIYLRRQDNFLVSEYGQHVRMYPIRYTGSIYDFYIRHNFIHKLNYWVLLSRWAEVFGASAVKVRIYDRNQFPDGSVVSDFLKTVGVDVSGLKINSATRTNENLHPVALEVLRRFNEKRLDERTHLKLLNLLDGIAVNGDYDLLSKRNRRDLIGQFRHSNARVAQKWFSRENGVLFDEETAKGTKSSLTESVAGQSAIIDLLLNSVLSALQGFGQTEPSTKVGEGVNG